MVRGSRGRLDYLVIDGQLQKRSRYYIFKDWAETLEGKWFLHKQDRESGFSCWCLDAQLLSGGPWTMPRESRAVFKNDAEHVQTCLGVLSQMGGCPCEFVEPVHQPAAGGRSSASQCAELRGPRGWARGGARGRPARRGARVAPCAAERAAAGAAAARRGGGEESIRPPF